MGTISLQIPQPGLPNDGQDAKISANLAILQDTINGKLDATNFDDDAGILASQCAFTPLSVGTVYTPPMIPNGTGTFQQGDVWIVQIGILGGTLSGITVLVTIPNAQSVTVALFNSIGSQVAASNSTALVSGPQQIPFASTYHASSGIYYICFMTAGGASPTLRRGLPLCPSKQIHTGGSLPGSITPPTTPSASVPFMATY